MKRLENMILRQFLGVFTLPQKLSITTTDPNFQRFSLLAFGISGKLMKFHVYNASLEF